MRSTDLNKKPTQNVGSDWKKTKNKIDNLGLETRDEKDALVFENAKYEKALEEIQDISFRMIGHMWEEDSSKIEKIAKAAING